jgi:hypothetical protein
MAVLRPYLESLVDKAELGEELTPELQNALKN